MLTICVACNPDPRSKELRTHHALRRYFGARVEVCCLAQVKHAKTPNIAPDKPLPGRLQLQNVKHCCSLQPRIPLFREFVDTLRRYLWCKGRGIGLPQVIKHKRNQNPFQDNPLRAKGSQDAYIVSRRKSLQPRSPF